MKKILLTLAIFFLGVVYCQANAEEANNTKAAVNTTISQEEINQLANDSIETLIELKKEYFNNIVPAVWIYLTRYQMYECVKSYENSKDDFKKLAKEADYINNKIRNNTYYYDSNTQKRIYTSLSKTEAPVLKTIIENLSLLESKNKETLDTLKEKGLIVKNNPDRKKIYNKEDLKSFHRTIKMANRDYKKVKSLNDSLKDSARVNKINYSEKLVSSYKQFPKPYDKLPTREYIENDIINNSSDIACKTDTPAYYNKINQKREEILPILASLLVTAETNKELELKRKNVYAKISNLSDKEKDATLSKLLAEEEAEIMKALEAQDIDKKIQSFSQEQKEQYNSAIKKLNEITLIQLDRLAGQVADAYSAYKSSDGDVLKALSQYSEAHPAPTYEESIYIEIIQRRGSESSKKILERLSSFDNTVNLEKNLDKSMKVEKQKKAKKIKEDDMDFE